MRCQNSCQNETERAGQLFYCESLSHADACPHLMRKMCGDVQAGLPPGPKFFSVAQLLQSQSQADRKGRKEMGAWGQSLKLLTLGSGHSPS